MHIYIFTILFLLVYTASAQNDSLDTPTDTLEDSFIIKGPELISFTQPIYPQSLVKNSITGTISIDIFVTENGRVDSVNIIGSLHPVLDSLVVFSFNNAIFNPALDVHGQKAAVIIRTSYSFTPEQVVKHFPEFSTIKGAVLEKGSKKNLSDICINLILDIDSIYSIPIEIYLKSIPSHSGTKNSKNETNTCTDSLGNFYFHKIPPCSATIVIVHPGYEKYEKRIEIIADENEQISIWLKKGLNQSYEIVVYGNKKINTPVSITRDEAKSVSAVGEDVFQAIRILPAISQPRYDKEDELVIRGAPHWASGFYYEGIPVHKIFHGIAPLPFLCRSLFPNECVENIHVFPGGFGVRYGNATGGIIDIEGASGNNDRFHLKSDVNVLDVSLITEIPLVKKKVSTIFSLRRTVLSDIISYFDNLWEDNNFYTPVPYFWDYFVRMDYDRNATNRFFMNIFGANDGYEIIKPENAGKKLEEIEFQADNSSSKYNAGIVGWDFSHPNKLLSNNFRLGFSLQDEKRGNLSINSNYLSKFKIAEKSLSLRNEFKISFSGDTDLILGMNIFHRNLKFDAHLAEYYVDLTDDSQISRNFSKKGEFGPYAIYTEMNSHPSENWFLTLGLRYDYYPEHNHKGTIIPELWDYTFFNNNRGIPGEPSLRISSRYLINDSHTLNASIGNYNHYAKIRKSVSQFGDYLNVPLLLRGNMETDNIRTCKGSHFIIGHNWGVNNYINSNIQLYINKWWDNIEFDYYGDYYDDYHVTSDGSGYSFGMETLIKFNFKKQFYGWISYCLSRVYESHIYTGELLLSPDNHTHDLQLVGTAQTKRNSYFGFRVRYISGYTYTPVIDAYYDANSNFYVPIYGKTNSSQLNPFFMVDISIKKVIYSKKFIVSFLIELQNSLIWLYKSPMDINIYHNRPYYEFNVKTGEEEFESFEGFCVPYFSLQVEY